MAGYVKEHIENNQELLRQAQGLHKPFDEGERESMERYITNAYGLQNDQEVKESLTKLQPSELRLEYYGAREAVEKVEQEQEKESVYRIKAW